MSLSVTCKHFAFMCHFKFNLTVFILLLTCSVYSTALCNDTPGTYCPDPQRFDLVVKCFDHTMIYRQSYSAQIQQQSSIEFDQQLATLPVGMKNNGGYRIHTADIDSDQLPELFVALGTDTIRYHSSPTSTASFTEHTIAGVVGNVQTLQIEQQHKDVYFITYDASAPLQDRYMRGYIARNDLNDSGTFLVPKPLFQVRDPIGGPSGGDRMSSDIGLFSLPSDRDHELMFSNGDYAYSASIPQRDAMTAGASTGIGVEVDTALGFLDRVQIIDIDGDSINDLLYLQAGEVRLKIRSAGYIHTVSIDTQPSQISSYALGDVTGLDDTHNPLAYTDIVAVSDSNKQINIYSWNITPFSGRFSLQAIVASQLTITSQVSLMDVNHDSRADIVYMTGIDVYALLHSPSDDQQFSSSPIRIATVATGRCDNYDKLYLPALHAMRHFDGTGQDRREYQCPKAHYCPVDSDVPVPCAASFYCPLQTETPIQCPIHHYCPAGSAVPIPCKAGQKCPVGATHPIPCDASKWCPAGTDGVDDSIIEQDCPASWYCEKGQDRKYCEAGFVCPQNSSSMTKCNDGYFCPAASAAQQPCPGGHYCKAGDGIPRQCPAGSFCAEQVSSPTLCMIGQYCPAQTTSPIRCPQGSYCPANSTLPTLCPTGSFCGEQSAEPTRCPPGTLCPAGSSAPIVCPAAVYCPSPDESVILLCPEGYYCPVQSTEPVLCPSSFYCPAASSAPIQCELGEVCEAGSSRPKLCAAGSVCESPHNATVCKAGYSCASGSTEPRACVTNQTSSWSWCPRNSSVEMPCPAGYTCPTPKVRIACNASQLCRGGAAEALPCPEAFFCPAQTKEPIPCDAGSLCLEGSAEPRVCDQGKYCPNATAMLDCPVGHFCMAGSVKPSSCPMGFRCIAGILIECDKDELCVPGTVEAEKCSQSIWSVASPSNTKCEYSIHVTTPAVPYTLVALFSLCLIVMNYEHKAYTVSSSRVSLNLMLIVAYSAFILQLWHTLSASFSHDAALALSIVNCFGWIAIALWSYPPSMKAVLSPVRGLLVFLAHPTEVVNWDELGRRPDAVAREQDSICNVCCRVSVLVLAYAVGLIGMALFALIYVPALTALISIAIVTRLVVCPTIRNCAGTFWNQTLAGAAEFSMEQFNYLFALQAISALLHIVLVIVNASSRQHWEPVGIASLVASLCIFILIVFRFLQVQSSNSQRMNTAKPAQKVQFQCQDQNASLATVKESASSNSKNEPGTGSGGVHDSDRTMSAHVTIQIASEKGRKASPANSEATTTTTTTTTAAADADANAATGMTSTPEPSAPVMAYKQKQHHRSTLSSLSSTSKSSSASHSSDSSSGLHSRRSSMSRLMMVRASDHSHSAATQPVSVSQRSRAMSLSRIDSPATHSPQMDVGLDPDLVRVTAAAASAAFVHANRSHRSSPSRSPATRSPRSPRSPRARTHRSQVSASRHPRRANMDQFV
jgi:hypothetical protein